MNIPDPAINVDKWILMASRAEVEAGDVTRASKSLKAVLTRESAERFRRRLIFGINGYDDEKRDLWEIEDVRAWMSALDKEFPLWFFFADLGPRSTLSMITFSLCRWKKVPGGKLIEPEDLRKFVYDRYVALKDFCEWLGYSQEQFEKLTAEVDEFYFGRVARPDRA